MTTTAKRLRIVIQVIHEGQSCGTKYLKADQLINEATYQSDGTTIDQPASLKVTVALRERVWSILADSQFKHVLVGDKGQLIHDLIVHGDDNADDLLPGSNNFIDVRIVINGRSVSIDNDQILDEILEAMEDGKTSIDLEVHTRGLDAEIPVDLPAGLQASSHDPEWTFGRGGGEGGHPERPATPSENRCRMFMAAIEQDKRETEAALATTLLNNLGDDVDPRLKEQVIATCLNILRG